MTAFTGGYSWGGFAGSGADVLRTNAWSCHWAKNMHSHPNTFLVVEGLLTSRWILIWLGAMEIFMPRLGPEG